MCGACVVQVVLVQRCELAHAPAADVRRCSEEARELVNRIKAVREWME